MADRSFYGGTPPTGTTGGEIDAGKYDGPEAHIEAPWKCPACGVQNEAPLKFGCVHCGSGQPGTHVGVQQPPRVQQLIKDVRWIMEPEEIPQAFDAWIRSQDYPPLHVTENQGILIAAFRAGWHAANAHAMRAAPPATADVEALAPEGKPRRTIVAALELFRDQVLSQAEAEIASGEWCSIEEVDQLIAQLQEETT